jgi:hypothetical protein
VASSTHPGVDGALDLLQALKECALPAQLGATRRELALQPRNVLMRQVALSRHALHLHHCGWIQQQASRQDEVYLEKN